MSVWFASQRRCVIFPCIPFIFLIFFVLIFSLSCERLSRQSRFLNLLIRCSSFFLVHNSLLGTLFVSSISRRIEVFSQIHVLDRMRWCLRDIVIFLDWYSLLPSFRSESWKFDSFSLSFRSFAEVIVCHGSWWCLGYFIEHVQLLWRSLRFAPLVLLLRSIRGMAGLFLFNISQRVLNPSSNVVNSGIHLPYRPILIHCFVLIGFRFRSGRLFSSKIVVIS